MRLPTQQVTKFKINRPAKNGASGTSRSIRSDLATCAILMGLVILILSPAADSKQKPFEADMPMVVIDPGHGGNDTGAQGPDGTLEKTVTLNLARLIARQLADSHRVVLTRSDDYRLEISSRTAVANQSKADIFISLHTGNSFIHSIAGSTVYFYQQFHESALSAEPKPPKHLTQSSLPVNWDQIQTKYRMTSEKLAKLIQSRLSLIWQPPHTKYEGAPLLVLEGADMPAVTIEIGNLSNPNEVKALRDPEFLSRIARAIAEGIDAFFAEKAK
jgi:N-acetylmuramoyl-L-alanine amidase